MRNRTHNKLRRVFAGSTLAVALIVNPAFAVDDQETTAVTHFMDSNTDRVPQLTAFPTYPSIARRDRIEGHAVVCFMIKSDGDITKVELRETSHSIFRKPALRAIKRSTFEPLSPNQVLATAKTCRTYRFRLEPILVENTDN